MRPVLTAPAIVLFSILLLGAFPAHAQTKVEVVNTPNVEVPSPIPHSRLERMLDLPVSPGSGSDGKKPFYAGNVEAAGFSRAVLSLAVEVSVTEPGAVGAMLIPDEPFVLQVFEKGRRLFPIYVEVPIRAGREDLHASLPVQQPLAFPSYQVYLYSTTDKPAKAQLFVYLTH